MSSAPPTFALFRANACLFTALSFVGACSDPADPVSAVDDAATRPVDTHTDHETGADRPEDGPAAVADASRALPSKQDSGARAAAASDAAAREPVDASLPMPTDAALPTTDAAMPSTNDCPLAAAGAKPASLKLTGDLGTHDPSMLSADGLYYEFQTGRGIPTKTSTDLLRWKAGASVFAQNPAWIAQQVPGATDLWAPDISRFGGKAHLYYSASTFGSNKSCIGHATRDSLSSGSWQDQGSVVCSNAGNAKDDWNAIDPNAVVDESGTPWLTFGSFWSGIKLVKLTAEGKRADNELTAIAGRKNGGAIEAPYIVRRCGWYYLFVSFDKCCSGADSTYRVMVGRSRSVKGPYVDRAGTAMLQGGGTQVVAGAGAWKGPGHSAVLLTDKGDYNVYHAYAASDGHSELRISELFWDSEAWPVSGGP